MSGLGAKGTKICPNAFFALVFSIRAFPTISEPGTGYICSIFGKNLEEKRQTECSFSFVSFTLLGKIQSVTIDNSNPSTTGLYTYKSMKSMTS